MGKGIRHFMWGYQVSFRALKEVEAERVLRRLDKRFKPEVFLVGIRARDARGNFIACVEPEDDFWIQSDDFDGVPAIAERILSTYPESGILQSNPIVQQQQNEALWKRSIRDAIHQVIESHPSTPHDITFRVSYPARVDNYWVSVALGVQSSVLGAYPSLNRSSVNVIHEYRPTPVAVSFIDATVTELLGQATEDLLRPDPGSGLYGRDADDFLRRAGDKFAQGVAARVDPMCIEGADGLFRSLNMISSLRYEKAVGAGRLLLGRREHPSVAEQVSFASPTALNNYRAVRKLVELASDDLPLFCNPERVFGLANIQTYRDGDEDLFQVEILGQHHWELRHNGKALMRVQYGLPSLPKLPFDEEKFRSDLRRIFLGIGGEDVDRLVALARTAERESHGTMLVITEAAETEAARLAPQGTPISPCQLSPELLKHLTPIDGALILSPTGVCHAIGTILDGKATQNGDPGRGARFNSAIRYYEAVEDRCIILVVSSDGGVDFVPNPRPAIRRSAVDEAINKIQELRNAKRLNKRLYSSTLDWLDDHRFYLTEQDCEILNPNVEEIEKRIHAEDPLAVSLVRQAFSPHLSIHDRFYYLPE
jgi:hypothetical protein